MVASFGSGAKSWLIGDIGAGELCSRCSDGDGLVERIPFFEIVDRPPGCGAVAIAEGVGFVADLEGNETRAEDALDSGGFGGSVFFAPLAEVEAAEAAPVGGVQIWKRSYSIFETIQYFSIFVFVKCLSSKSAFLW
jgi:hypothetical protein